MAEAAVPDDEKLLFINLHKFQELFGGRFNPTEAAMLIEYNDGDLQKAVNFCISAEPKAVRALINAENDRWITISSMLGRLQGVPEIMLKLRSGEIDTGPRLFGCPDCDSVWWKRTPNRKPVSKCHRCRKRYDAVPRDLEWGWAEFHCNYCKRQFGGWCAMNMQSPCYQCGRLTHPTRIVPPTERNRERRAKRMVHCCAAPDCPGRARYNGSVFDESQAILKMKCVHPASLRSRGLPQVIIPSQIHDSTGSTVDTFLSQTDLEKTPEYVFPTLPPVSEEEENQN